MALVDLLADGDLPPEARPLLDEVTREYGFVPNILRALGHCPDLLVAFVPLWAEVYQSPTIGPRLRALAALGTARAQECTYCVAHMTASARRSGVAEEEIAAVGDTGAQAAVFDEREALMLELAEVLTRDPDGVTDAMRTRLRDLFAENELVNIVLAIGMYNLTSRFLKALSIDVEEVFSGTLDPSARAAQLERSGQ